MTKRSADVVTEALKRHCAGVVERVKRGRGHEDDEHNDRKRCCLPGDYEAGKVEGRRSAAEQFYTETIPAIEQFVRAAFLELSARNDERYDTLSWKSGNSIPRYTS
jgi:hypothetical protein